MDHSPDAARQHEEIAGRTAPGGKIIHAAILREGREELARTTSALFWSGLAAGLAMGFSMVVEGLLRAHLPEQPWRPLVAKLGYSTGFLFVILGRQQLFTENTLTPILPLLQDRSAAVLYDVLRLWGVVLVANLLGGLLIAWAASRTNAFEPHARHAFVAIGHEAMKHGFGNLLWRGVFAGWLIALMVWLLPFAETARVWVIIIVTYVVGLAQLSHVVAGAIEVFVLAWTGHKSWATVTGSYVVPTLIGNVLGGVMLVAALNHAQVVAGGGRRDA
jgi:formate/nitrite transporter FocA (FNT family)